MYSLEYLPAARQDLVEIATYIRDRLGNAAAADRLARMLVKKCESISVFPYAYPVHTPVFPRSFGYRKAVVHHYMIIYQVNEEKKRVTIYRVIYGKRDWDTLLK